MTDAATGSEVAARAPWIAARDEGELLILELGGAWTTRRLGPQEAELDRVSTGGAGQVRIDTGAIEAMDTAGALLVFHTIKRLRAEGATVELHGAGTATASLIETVAKNDTPCPPPPPAEHPLVVPILRLGHAAIEVCRQGRDLINFLGLTIVVFFRLLRRPGRIRGVAMISHIEQTGLNALPIVGLISFLVGIVLAYQGADQLARFGAQAFTVNLVGISVLREMGILLTAIIVAGRTGSAFTAQIGTMAVNEEIDAMRTIGLDPMEVLVLPRIVALVLVMPLLTFYADILGLLGGAVMASVSLDISFFQFTRQISAAVGPWSFWIGMIKAPVFGFIIALVGCYEGLRVVGSAESVGRQTTRAVVEAVFLVIVLDAAFSILFSVLGV